MNSSIKYNLLLVDDEPEILSSLYRNLRKQYNCLKAEGGQKAIDLINSEPIDLIICDQRMPTVTGDQVLTHAHTKQPDSIRILLTGYADFESLVKAVNNGQMYRYIAKPWDMEELKITIKRALESLQLNRDLVSAKLQIEKSYHNTINMLCVASEGKDEDTASHIQRVRFYTQSLALKMGINKTQSEQMGMMSILHDIGKMFVPDAILKKPGPLDDTEWEIMKLHPENGVKILGDDPFYQLAAEISLGHHENFDGSGYPSGIQGEQIPLTARIVKIADVFDALTTKRPYKDPWPIEKAMAFLVEKRNIMFDPELIDHMISLHQEGIITQIYQSHQD